MNDSRWPQGDNIETCVDSDKNLTQFLTNKLYKKWARLTPFKLKALNSVTCQFLCCVDMALRTNSTWKAVCLWNNV